MKTLKIIILSASAVGLTLFIAVGFILFRGITRFNTARADLDRAKTNLERYYEAPIFPSRENVDKELANAEQIDAWFDELMGALGKGNVTSKQRSPSKFKNVFEVARKRLVNEGQKAGTELPASGQPFAFGFDRYSGTGTLPKPQDVPRLTEELVIINRLTHVLFKHRVKAISKIERVEFEGKPGTAANVNAPAAAGGANSGNSRRRPSSRRGRSGRSGAAQVQPNAAGPKNAGVIGNDDLFAKLHFVFEFRAKESALLEIINALSAQPMFVVVTSLSLSKETPELVPKPAEVEGDSNFGGVSSTPADAVVTHRLGPNYPVCGIKMEIPLDIRLELDVYKFREAAVDSGD
jgi:hypothetical protein